MTYALIAAVVLALLVGLRLRKRDPVALLDDAVKAGKVDGVLAALHAVAPGSQPTEYHRVLKHLWEGYHREEAAQVAKDFARHHREAPTAQYWLKQLIQIEPDIAKEHLDEAFMASFFDPTVASKCGSYG